MSAKQIHMESQTGFRFGMRDSDVWKLLMLAMMLPLVLSPLSLFYKNLIIDTWQNPKYAFGILTP